MQLRTIPELTRVKFMELNRRAMTANSKSSLTRPAQTHDKLPPNALKRLERLNV